MSQIEVNIERVYNFDQDKKLNETEWPDRWLRTINNKLLRRCREAKHNAFLKRTLTELLEECKEVKFSFFSKIRNYGLLI